jgi:transcriptional regulator with XRE-family HTH domain
MSNHGKQLKLAIKGKGLTVEAAAAKLEMSRQNLYGYYNRSELDDSFLQNVKSKLDIDPAQIIGATKKVVKETLEGTLGDYAERLIRLEASVKVFGITLAGLVAKDNGQSLAKVSLEMETTINEEVNRLFDEFGIGQ